MANRFASALPPLALVTLVVGCGTDRLRGVDRRAPSDVPLPAAEGPPPGAPEQPPAERPPSFSLSSRSGASVSESTEGLPAKRLSFEVRLERLGFAGELSVDVVVCAQPASCTAVYGKDFLLSASFTAATPRRARLTFPAGIDTQSVTVFVLDDAERDGDRTLSLTLHEPSAPAVLAAAAQGLLITDDDPQEPVFSFSSTNPVSLGEAQIGSDLSARFTVHLERNGDARNMQVQLTVCAASDPCTAAPGVDFGTLAIGLPFQMLYFMNGATDVEVSLPLFDDDLIDGERVVTLTLSSPTPGASIHGESWRLTLTDDEQDVGPVFRFADTNPTNINEAYAAGVANRALPLTVELLRRGNTESLAVQLEVCATGSGCSATGGPDYQLDASFTPFATLLFPPGATQATTNVHIVDDRVRDGTRRLTLRLRNPSPGTRIAGGVAALDLLDDESPALDGYSFRYTRTLAPESAGDGVAAVVIDRNGPDAALREAGLVEVRLDQGGSSAVLGLDFGLDDDRTPLVGSPQSATVIFPAGARSRRFLLRTVADAVADGDKHLVVNLGNPQGAPLGDVTRAMLHLVDRESLAFGLDGRAIATLELSEVAFPGGNRCDVNTTAAGSSGPCGASPVPPSPCDEGMIDPITHAWLVDVDPHALAGNTLHLPLRPQHALSFRFRTPPGDAPAMYMFTTDEAAPSVGPNVQTFTSISAGRCDFDIAKLDYGHTCFQIGASNTKWAVTGPAADEGVSTYCMLQPDAEYYFNIRMDGGTGLDQCLSLQRSGNLPTGACGILVATFAYDTP